MEKKYIYDHTSFETAYEVSNYPWGFRLRTEVKYWIETQDKKSGGERLCICTKDPRTGKWCKPKKSNYSDLEFLYLDENNHVKTEVLNHYSEPEKIEEFIKNHREHLSEYQIKTIKYLKAYNEVMQKVEFSLKPVFSREEGETLEQKNKDDLAKISSWIGHSAKTQTV